MRRFAVTSLLAFTVVAAAPAAADAASCSGANRSPVKLGQRATIRTTLCLLNQERARYGLRPLAPEPHLELAAQSHSRLIHVLRRIRTPSLS